MAKYLTNVVETYRISTEQEVENFLKELKEDNRFTLKSFAYKKKDIKEKKEIVEEYFLATVKKEFNLEKEPDSEIEVSYERAFYLANFTAEKEK